MKFALIILAFFACSGSLSGQVTLYEEAEITALMEKFKQLNSRVTFFRGWRIQVLTTSDRLEMENGIRKFQSIYPDMDFEWEHNPPYYQVKAGTYELRSDLDKTLLEIKKDFPAAMPIQAEMAKKELLNTP